MAFTSRSGSCSVWSPYASAHVASGYGAHELGCGGFLCFGLRRNWFGVWTLQVWTPISPFAGFLSNESNIGGTAFATGNHLWKAQNWLIRIPIRKTIKGPSMSAVNRPGKIFGI